MKHPLSVRLLSNSTSFPDSETALGMQQTLFKEFNEEVKSCHPGYVVLVGIRAGITYGRRAEEERTAPIIQNLSNEKLTARSMLIESEKNLQLAASRLATLAASRADVASMHRRAQDAESKLAAFDLNEVVVMNKAMRIEIETLRNQIKQIRAWCA